MISNDALAERLNALGAEIRADIQDLRQTVLIQNGSINQIKLERAREEGARAAVAEAATAATRLKEKSRAWKLGVAGAFATALGGVVTIGTLVAHALIQHHP